MGWFVISGEITALIRNVMAEAYKSNVIHVTTTQWASKTNVGVVPIWLSL